MRALMRVAVRMVLACAALVAPSAASAAAAKPYITDLRISPDTVPAQGGTITVTAIVRHAKSCLLTGPGTQAHKVVCANGSFRLQVLVPPNTGSTQVVQVLLRAYNRYGITSRHQAFLDIATGPSSTTTTPSTAPAPPVANLDACTAGPDCDYGPIYATYNNYGNVAPESLGDCTFAAAAYWEQIVLNVTPDPTVIGYEFAQAGGTSSGLSQGSLWSYWIDDGIGGEYLTGLHSYNTDQTDVQHGVRAYGAMIVQFSFIANDYVGDIQVTAGGHDAVVDGFTPEGPLIVSWGETIQMTWQQWNDEVVDMWGIGAGPTPMQF